MKKQGESSFFAPASLTDGATALCRAGRRAEGLADLAKAQGAAHETFPGSGREDAIDYAWGACLIADGRIDGAARMLEGIDAVEVSQLAGDPD